MNAGQRAGLHGTYGFTKPHSSYRARLRRLKQIAAGHITPAQVDLTRVDASDLTRSVQQAATGDDFSITYEDDDNAETIGYHDTDDRSAVEPRPADQTPEEAQGIPRE